MRVRSVVLLGAVTLGTALPSGARGQALPNPPVPQILTTSRGEVEIKPDRAQVTFSVDTRATTAAAAAADNSRRQRAVLDTLQRLGISVEQMQTASLQVTPEVVYPGQGLPPKVTGYVARNSVRVEILKLDQAGVLIDAGLAKGATGIGGLQFYSSKTAEARREALSRAVSAARLDADAMAKAAGLQVGSLIEIIANPSYEPPMLSSPAPQMMRASTDMGPTPVNPGELKVVETVTIRWAIKQ